MAEDIQVKRVIDDNGRRVETHTYETVTDGRRERITETHVEQVPMALQERIVEKIAPVITARTKEIYKDGKIVDSVVEELDRSTMKMSSPPPVPTSNAVTKEELVELLREILKTTPPAEDEEKAVKKLKKKVKAVVAEEEVEEIPNTNWEWFEMGLYVVLSGELAFCLYHLVLKNWI